MARFQDQRAKGHATLISWSVLNIKKRQAKDPSKTVEITGLHTPRLQDNKMKCQQS